MSESQRTLSSPFSSSPGRLPSISRPEWPWSTRSYSHRASQSSMHSSTLLGSHLQASYESSRPASSAASSSGTPLPAPLKQGGAMPNRYTSSATPGETTRQWSMIGLEWTIHELQKLKDFVEGSQPNDQDFEVLKQSPIMGDNFKLEIVSHTSNDDQPTSSPQTLSLCVTSLMMDFAQGDYEMPASMMTAIRCQNNRIGDRAVRADWVWQHWQHDWVFRRESEFWECPLPPMSELLQNPRIREADSLILCVQIHAPAGPSIPEQPSVAYVPRDLLDGLEASLDNPNTGDIRFVCLERLNPEIHANVLPESPELDTEHPQRPPSSTSTSTPSSFSSTTTARKRVIYAHSDILTRRSEYFATMLSSAFSEGIDPVIGERKIYTVVVEEADFETMYWLLKFCYANWLQFKENDDPRAAVEGIGAGWSVKWLASREGEWDWKTFHKAGFVDSDGRSATSVESLAESVGVSRSASATSEVFQQPPITVTAIASSTSSLSKSTPNSSVRSGVRRTTGTGSTLPISIPGSSSISRSKPDIIPPSTNRYQTPKQHPVSPLSVRPQPPSIVSTPDPHPHPTATPPPASALSMYQVAHRYSMPGLANLSLEHIMTTVTPESSFALLLATHIWEELNTLIQDYVIENWEEVSSSEAFDHCCQEIAAGEWGPNGGKTLTAVFRRLRSPGTVS